MKDFVNALREYARTPKGSHDIKEFALAILIFIATFLVSVVLVDLL